MNEVKDPIIYLMEWYASQCDGDWEHQFGVKIDTLDNPGWTIEIDLIYTELEDVIWDKIKIDRTENDWIHAFIEDKKWKAACGPLNLLETIEKFIFFVKENKKKASK